MSSGAISEALCRVRVFCVNDDFIREEALRFGDKIMTQLSSAGLSAAREGAEMRPQERMRCGHPATHPPGS